MKEYYPTSPAGYRTLADLYFQKSDFDKAANAYEEQIARFPDDAEAHSSLIGVYFRLRNFSKAELSLEEFGKKYQADPFRLQTYYGMKANLANWRGKFLTSLGYRHQAVEQAFQTRDSLRITQSLEIMSLYFDYYGFPDSALYYCRQIGQWATFFVRLNHPLQLVTYDRDLADSLRPVMTQMANEFRARVPAELMKIADNIEALFDAFAAADTARIITVFEQLLQQGGTSTSARRNIGELCVLSGQYQKGKESLEQYLRDPDTPVAGFWYPYGQYLLGLANEELGNVSEAVKNYQETLKYWDGPEIEIPAIMDARSRLARLKA